MMYKSEFSKHASKLYCEVPKNMLLPAQEIHGLKPVGIVRTACLTFIPTRVGVQVSDSSVSMSDFS